MVTDDQGKLSAKLRHLPYGEVHEPSSYGHERVQKKFASFTGQEMDNDTGLVESVELIRTRRKTLEIAVHPDRSIVVRAPWDAELGIIQTKLNKCKGWINRQRAYFQQFEPRAKPKQYLSGESFLYLGRQYRLRIEQGPAYSVRLKAGFFILSSSEKPNREELRAALQGWYRKRAKQIFVERFHANLHHFPEYDPTAIRLSIREMKTRWGSLSKGKILTLNLDLIRTPKECIDYVIIHELCHLTHERHTPEFYALLEKKLPDWIKRKEILEVKLA